MQVIAAEQDARTGENGIKGLKEKWEKLGFSTADYKDAEMVGIEVTKTYKLKNVSSKDQVSVRIDEVAEGDIKEEIYFQKIKNGLFSTMYKATFVFDTSDDKAGMGEYGSSFDLSYSVTLPRKAKANNADEVEGNKYIWNINYGEKKVIEYEIKVVNRLLVFGIAFVLVAVSASTAVLIIKKRKQSAKG
jgi:hypothetical protein